MVFRMHLLAQFRCCLLLHRARTLLMRASNRGQIYDNCRATPAECGLLHTQHRGTELLPMLLPLYGLVLAEAWRANPIRIVRDDTLQRTYRKSFEKTSW